MMLKSGAEFCCHTMATKLGLTRLRVHPKAVLGSLLPPSNEGHPQDTLLLAICFLIQLLLTLLPEESWRKYKGQHCVSIQHKAWHMSGRIRNRVDT